MLNLLIKQYVSSEALTAVDHGDNFDPFDFLSDDECALDADDINDVVSSHNNLKV